MPSAPQSVVATASVASYPNAVDEDDTELAVRARGGDTGSYRILVERYQTLAFRTAYLITRSTEDAQDATQEGFVKAYLGLDRFRQGGRFRPWLLAIVANEAKNRVRSEGRRLWYERTSSGHADIEIGPRSPEHAAIASDLSANLLDAVNALPEGERLVVGLRYFLELSEAETAAAADIPIGTVKSRMARAMGRLRMAIGDTDVRP